METLANLESFVRSAESGSFSAAARRLGLTPAAVSRNVALLERNLGVQLFMRSTRGLTLSEAGERFQQSVQGGLDSIQGAIADIKVNAGQPAGVLKLSAAPGFGMDYLLPLMPAFLERYPGVVPDWVFDSRPLDLIAGGFDAAIGAGFELPPGMVARELARIHLIAVAAPALLQGKRSPKDPSGLAEFPNVVIRSPLTGRLRTQVMRNHAGAEVAAKQRAIMLVNDPDALSRAVVLGLGVGLIPVPHAAPHLESGALVRLLPNWYGDVGAVSLYFTSQKLLPAKTRVFIDFVVEAFRAQNIARLLSAK
ncbi:LysR family transcriptional regulator [Duganella sp. BJB488]|uniref:LysR family transcriptional regulator n=1 Tax=unclassified Duganella TaxID=2636909 RepID=UPI000E355304|nr:MULTISPECIES: LysR family transcriptional regulator [unclassified Duganella]NVD69000.1 LysR family transcriptional regulator [Duganella sp. BJB1802]RFP16858.1 LysR family transcriptional regulator [Duganella sp. BJB489]RFP20724.1 LysR family transcriptional regulator [Duganella sp. BJB488]RFP32219.1 LysR family transcriptional regulator [Duganella sp. BJB480]